jgi:two-component system sensor histidine kinase YesM
MPVSEEQGFMFRRNRSSFLNYLTISQKMVLILLGSVIIPLAIQNAFYYSDTERNIQSRMMQQLTDSLDEKTGKVNAILSGTITLSHRYNTNEDLYRFLDVSYAKDLNYLVEYQDRIEKTLLSDLAYGQYVRNINLYTDNPTVISGSIVSRLSSNDFVSLGDKLIDYRLYNLTNKENGPKLRISLISLVIKSASDRALSIVRPLTYYPQYSTYRKYLRIDIDASRISDLLGESSLFDNIVLVDRDNRILASANTYRESGLYDIFTEDPLKAGMVVLKQPLKDVPLTLYGFYNTKLISDEFSKTRWKTAGIAIGTMVFALFCIWLVAGNLTRRARVVVNQSKQIAKGNFIQVKDTAGGRDEIEILAESMNQMSMKLKTLIEEEYNSRIKKAQLERETAQAKLLALQSQVNPHFMFNALETIRLKAVARNETETARMILYMSRMFRRLIKWNDDITSLQEEIAFLKEFLNIQKYRFDDEFEYVVQVDEPAQCCLLPKFIIQPLAENACVHGAESISSNRLIKINVARMENLLEIRVADNGSGIDEERLEDLKEMLREGKKPTESVGLHNVYQRLVLYYGSGFSFDMGSEKGKGTEFRITIPVRCSKEEFCVLNSVG